MNIAGEDEAGRGPLIGPLVMCIAVIDEKDESKLKTIGVKDSKLLSEKQREEMFEKIKKIVKYKLSIIPPKEIDEAVNSDETNLNWLEADKSSELINEMEKEIKFEKVIIDCPSPNIKKYTEYLKNKIKNKKITIKAEHKADLKYIIVSAASVLAKVTRDREILKLKKKYNVDFGSGYPADPRTSEFVKDNYNKYDFFRKSWGTYRKILKERENVKKQKSLSDFK